MKIGDTVRPELGKTDYSGYLAGSAQGSKALGTGIAALGVGAGEYLKGQKTAVKDTAGTAKLMKEIGKQYKGTPFGDRATQMGIRLEDQDIPLRQRFAEQSIGREMIGVGLDKMHRDTEEGFKGRAADLADRAGTRADLANTRADEYFTLQERNTATREHEVLRDDRQEGGVAAAQEVLSNYARGPMTKESLDTLYKRFEPQDPEAVEAYRGEVYHGIRGIQQQQQQYDRDVQTGKFLDPAEKARRRVIAVDVGKWESKGRNEAANQMKLLAAELKVAEAAEAGGKRWVDTGPITSFWGKRFKAETKAAEQRIQGIVGSTLRATLGAAFTQEEGERIFAQSFDPMLPEEENVKKLKQLVDTLQDSITNAEQRGEDYHSENWGGSGGAGGGGGGGFAALTEQELVVELAELERQRKQQQQGQPLVPQQGQGQPLIEQQEIEPGGTNPEEAPHPPGFRDLNDIPRAELDRMWEDGRLQWDVPNAQKKSNEVVPDVSKSFTPTHSSTAGRRARAAAGGATVLLDSNSKKGDGITPPLVVIPDDATKEQRAAASAYVKAMARLQRDQFGRTLKPRVLTRSQNKKNQPTRKNFSGGRPDAFHTEGFAITDEKMVEFIKTPEGRAIYLGILNSTLGKMTDVTFTLPHSANDPGAVHKGTSEVRLAQYLMGE